uniref:PlsC domain-containing protein n=1 Tax=Steinernema glaseri TaxID=37863 RepID=A0A1I8AQQ2_9BILA
MLSILVTAHELKAVVPALYLGASQLPFATAALGIGAASWVLPAKCFRSMDNFLYAAYKRTCLFIFENLSGVTINFYGDIDELRKKKETALVICNHQSDVDWAIIDMLALRQSPEGGENLVRFMVKHAISFVPLFGWYVYQHGYIYVRRFGKYRKEPVERQLNYLGSMGEPFWLALFPEGTRFTKKRPDAIKKSDEICERIGVPKLNNVLVPRPGAFFNAFEGLMKNGALEAVYDVTIGYGQTRQEGRHGRAPNMFEFVCGNPTYQNVHVHVRRFTSSEIPADAEHQKQWLVQRYQEKDKMLDEYYSKGQLPDLREANVPRISLYRSLIPAFAFGAALVAPIYSERAREVYIATIATSPFLIAWLNLRGCI